MRSSRESVKPSRITKFKLQNKTYKQFQLRKKKCSFVQIGHIWHFGHLWKVYAPHDCLWLAIACQTSHFLSTVLLECLLECLRELGKRPLSCLFVSFGKSTRDFNLPSISRTFPPVLSPVVPCSGCLGRRLICWKCTIYFLQDIVLFYRFCVISF